MNWLLVVVLVVLLGNAIIGMRVGLIKTIFSLVSMILAVILTIWISPVVKDYLMENEKIYDSISGKVIKMLPFGEEVEEDKQEDAIGELKLPKSIKESLIKNNTTENYAALASNSFKEYVSHYLTGMIINGISFIGTFLAISILLGVICIALDLISKLPLLNSMNKTAGLLAGAVHGLILVWLGFILLTVFGSTQLGQKMMEMIAESEFLSIIYNNNFLLHFITGITMTIL